MMWPCRSDVSGSTRHASKPIERREARLEMEKMETDGSNITVYGQR